MGDDARWRHGYGRSDDAAAALVWDKEVAQGAAQLIWGWEAYDARHTWRSGARHDGVGAVVFGADTAQTGRRRPDGRASDVSGMEGRCACGVT